MKRSRYTEAQINRHPERAGHRGRGAELCRKHGMRDATFTTGYNWKSKYGWLEVSEAKRLRALTAGNAKLKRLCPTRCWTTPG